MASFLGYLVGYLIVAASILFICYLTLPEEVITFLHAQICVGCNGN